jgi:hypothetical protein
MRTMGAYGSGNGAGRNAAARFKEWRKVVLEPKNREANYRRPGNWAGHGYLLPNEYLPLHHAIAVQPEAQHARAKARYTLCTGNSCVSQLRLDVAVEILIPVFTP